MVHGRTVFPFRRRETILTVFVCMAVIMGVAHGIVGGSWEGWLFGLLTILVYSALAWFTYQRQALPTWVMIGVLIITGTGYFYDSLVALMHGSNEGILLLLGKAAVGIYLTWGALILHRERHWVQ